MSARFPEAQPRREFLTRFLPKRRDISPQVTTPSADRTVFTVPRRVVLGAAALEALAGCTNSRITPLVPTFDEPPVPTTNSRPPETTTAQPTPSEPPKAPEPNYNNEVTLLISNVSNFVYYRAKDPETRNLVEHDNGSVQITINTGTARNPCTDEIEYDAIYLVRYTLKDPDDEELREDIPVPSRYIETITVGMYHGQSESAAIPIRTYTLTAAENGYTIEQTDVVDDIGDTTYSSTPHQPLTPAFQKDLTEMNSMFDAAHHARYHR